MQEVSVLLEGLRQSKREIVYRIILKATAGLSGKRGDNAVSALVAEARQTLKAQATKEAVAELFNRGLTDAGRSHLHTQGRLSQDAHILWSGLLTLKTRASEANAIRRAAAEDESVRASVRAFLSELPGALDASLLLAKARTANAAPVTPEAAKATQRHEEVEARAREAAELCRVAKNVYDVGVAKGLLLALQREGKSSPNEVELMFARALAEAPSAIRAAARQ